MTVTSALLRCLEAATVPLLSERRHSRRRIAALRPRHHRRLAHAALSFPHHRLQHPSHRSAVRISRITVMQQPAASSSSSSSFPSSASILSNSCGPMLDPLPAAAVQLLCDPERFLSSCWGRSSPVSDALHSYEPLSSIEHDTGSEAELSSCTPPAELLSRLRLVLLWTARIVCAVSVLAVLVLVTAVSVVIFLRNGDGINVQYEWWLSGQTLESAEAQCLQRPRSSIIVSLTSLPDRLPFVHRTVKTLLLQTRCPQQILLWLPRVSLRLKTEYALPASLLAFNASSRVFGIRWSDRDWGPATKVVPMLQWLHSERRLQQRLMVTDDDMLYTQHTIAQYDCYSSLYPHTALGLWGCSSHHPDVRNCSWGSDLLPRHSRSVDILFGTASYLVQPALFDLQQLAAYNLSALLPERSEAELQRLLAAAFYEDDVWLSLSLALSGSSRLVVPVEHDRYAPLDTLFFYRHALSHAENADYAHFNVLRAAMVEIVSRLSGQQQQQQGMQVVSDTELWNSSLCNDVK